MRAKVAFVLFVSAVSSVACGMLLSGDDEPACAGGDCLGADAGDAGTDTPPLICPAGRGNCDGDRTNECETDLVGSAKHCGECGHDCKGVSCDDGVCRPTEIAVPPNALGLAIDGAEVFLTVEAPPSIYGCTLNTSNCIQRFTQTVTSTPGNVAVDATHVYWTTTNGVTKCQRPACTSVQDLAVGLPAGVVVVNASAAYHDDINNAMILRRPKPGLDAGLLATCARDPRPSFALDATDLYWIEGNAGLDFSIRRCPHAGCPGLGAVLYQVTGDMSIEAVAVDATHFFWTESAGSQGKVKRRAKDLGSSPEVLVEATATPGVLVLDDTYAYWIERGSGANDGKILRVAKTGGAPLVLAKGQMTPQRLALGAGAIYWTTKGPTGTLMTLAK